ncbi:helix-turn-helix transcriptional regulator [uncultured Intestinimonas sp.]|uniref:helix-turn-helix domain-containing protein n=1 Tax=uncultured Intestinimonas sp. TaxID=1689265 RepID=UPI0025DBD4F4|nr:helix-turn-helix transcriptional regulator [uncultured Intestinimonas sp.]
MQEIDKARFGAFLARLRKEKGMTQRELADRLHVSDKAVSKWERALSLPDVSLLIPLADCLGVSVTELLRGERTERESLPVTEVEALVNASLRLTGEEREADGVRRRRKLAFGLCALAGLAQTAALLTVGGFDWAALEDSVLLVEGLCLLFGAWLCFGAKERLPAYYD